MSGSRSGETPVGVLEELSDAEVRVIGMLRRWGDDGTKGIAEGLRPQLGGERAAHAAETFTDIASVLSRYGRRPLMRHSAACPCVGGDEACFARLICAAADGDREDAMMLACLMVRADLSPALVGLAEQLGLALRSANPRAGVRVH